MAFHPFHWFRKHQKVIFAILTIICMIVFVASFGVGDPFSRMRGGPSRPAGKYVATIYGRKVYEGDLETLALQRSMVNDLMVGGPDMRRSDLMGGLVRLAQFKLLGEFQQARTRLPGDLDQLLKGIFDRIQVIFVERLQGQSDPAANFRQIRGDLQLVGRLRWGHVDKPDTLKLLDELSTMLEMEAYFSSPARKQNDLYFGGTRSTEDLLDFMIWQNQADRLGIALTEVELVKALTVELGGVDVLQSRAFAKSPLIRQFLEAERRDMNTSEARLLKAVTDEMRVQMARRAILGQETGFRAYRGGDTPSVVRSPAALTPDQFLDVFRDKLTSENLAVLDVPVESYLGQVTTQPRVSDLDRLYNQFKDKVPAPRASQPGFKAPHRASFAYFTIKVDDPYFQDRARTFVLAQSLQQVINPLSVLGSHAGGVFAIPGLQFAGLQDSRELPAALQSAYFHYETNQKNLRYGEFGAPIVRDSHLFRAEPLVATVAQATAARCLPTPAGLGGMMSIPWALVGSTTVSQEAEREKIEKPYVTAAALAGLPPTTGTLFLLAGGLTKTKIEAVPVSILTPRLAAPILLRAESAKEARRIVNDTISELRKELAKADPKKKDELIQETIKKAGLEKTYHAMKHPEDRYALDTDKDLQPLKTTFEAEVPPERRADFGAALLMVPTTYELNHLNQPPKPVYIFWKTEDIKAREPNSMEEVRSQVEEAWRWLAARELARKKTQEIEKVLQERWKEVGDVDDLVKFLRDRKIGNEKTARVFELEKVARLVNVRGATQTQSKAYDAYTPSKDKIEYPLPDFAARVLGTLKAKGDSMVLPDEPQRHFYVILSTYRWVPGVKDLLDTYSLQPDSDPFWSQVAVESSVEDYQKRVLTELRTAAAGARNVNEQGQIVLPAEIRKTFDVITDSGE